MISNGFHGWHADCFEVVMQSEMIAMLIPAGSPGAALLVRRSNGQFAFGRIDARVARAARLAARLIRRDSTDSDPSASALEGLEQI